MTAITGAALFTGAGAYYPTATIVMSEGKILAVGPDVTPPAGAAGGLLRWHGGLKKIEALGVPVLTWPK